MLILILKFVLIKRTVECFIDQIPRDFFATSVIMNNSNHTNSDNNDVGADDDNY